MSQYTELSQYYDRLTEDQPYDLWQDIVETYVPKRSNLKIFDIGCGTGSLTHRLTRLGQVTGMDLSVEMLALARAKSRDVRWLEGDMSDFDLKTTFDVITIFCDALNYLKDTEAVKATFENVYKHLDQDGVFIFDVHTIYKMETLFHNQTYRDEQEDFMLVWDAVEGEEPYSVWHDMTFFIQDNNDLYRRVDESHYQQTYTLETYATWLKEAGFSDIETFYDFDRHRKDEHSDRLFFVVKK
ncbi:class I SAM-dependent DNA methyltransferase [Staphylococcus massiliensis]|uniref:Methyltransferase n=1 Tax=Staphylococcus massiliensis S46 TaxID=1229783 RepID=K9B889_9STAP|nr:class I SAM-dependent methyltransferase [Staphylococcus massiliensis]EKU49930.1 methyltransferase [Staphylococcus massiliensis S46]MCG3399034.1 class I SAM-dependent methyltransferase [Staphylococcus massiliensis]MCG3400968.1 class I SAM-dependent methyltransferase [Staphylococcus massiliensis]MCG3412504.1 class I SAM-dependent methyltransferase [Staphylococcus massiliensis]PNZ98929.1 class I SAM-dependent methyltransferase [Staphylococcus massiliensis CCUG 55927]